MTTCRTCAVPVSEGDWACSNGHDPLASPPPAPEPGSPVMADNTAPVVEVRAGARAAVSGEQRASTATPCPAGCGQMVLPDWDRCSLCDTPLNSSCDPSLVGPWGTVSVPPEGLELGREAGPADVQTVLAAYANVSRRHASIVPLDAGWVVTDLGSTNGTTVEGIVVPRGGAVTLVDGCTVGLGATARFIVRLGGSC